tara:strand:- start:144 stop:332 length:189 start_codon:yes stop_codon:yes gene_type:complete
VEVVEEDPETLDIHIPIQFQALEIRELLVIQQKVLLHQIMLVLVAVVDREIIALVVAELLDR